MAATDELRITFLGGADEIGASSALVQCAGTSVLVDCGVRFQAGRALPDLAELTGRRLDAILVTHAHTDHTGALPVVHEAFPTTPVLLSPPTIDLVRILSRDAIRLMQDGWERSGAAPLYTEAAVESLFQVATGVGHGETRVVGEFEVTWLPASHILGASMVHIATPGGSVLFTGDYSVEAQRTVPALDRPALRADVVVTESTYGDRLHADRRTAERRLAERVAEVVAAGGRVLIPAFAIGRAQEILLILRQAIEAGRVPDAPVFVDGMVRAVCEVYRDHPRYTTAALAGRIARGHPFYTDRIQPVLDEGMRREVLAAGPCVIVASSGMLAGGPSAYYAAEMAGDSANAILVTGYQDEESPGRALLSLAAGEGPRKLHVGGREVEVRCSFETYGLSAHADRMQMAGLLEAMRPSTVVLVHGDAAAKRRLAGSISCPDVVAAANGDSVARRHERRRGGRPRARPETEIGPEQAANLVTGAPGGAIGVDQVAWAWFGRPVAPILAERLVAKLVEHGVVVRDDHRRGLLRVVEREAKEDPLAADLRAENPKGKLLELLMRRRAEPPILEARVSPDGRRFARLKLLMDGEAIESTECEAGSARVAEQLAARDLLARLAMREAEEDARPVDEAEAARLKIENPKGRLLERCQAERRPPPEFVLRPLATGGFVARAELAGAERPLRSDAHRAAAARAAEQAAAADLLARLEGAPPATVVGGSAAPGGDPQAELNELRQHGVVTDFGYELVERRGPAHRPEFVVRAFALLPDGRRVDAAGETAPSMKEARRAAAEALRTALRASPTLRR